MSCFVYRKDKEHRMKEGRKRREEKERGKGERKRREEKEMGIRRGRIYNFNLIRYHIIYISL